jgi:hypothetical protein
MKDEERRKDKPLKPMPNSGLGTSLVGAGLK